MSDESPVSSHSRTPLFAAQQAGRYERQSLIRQYESEFGANLVVMMDSVFHHSITLVHELLDGCDTDRPLHLLLSSPGGDGEVAIRLLRALQSHCGELTIIVPDMAKSAATIMCLGADSIMMSPSSDLGPVDPQFPINGQLVGAKEIERAVSDAEARIAQEPNSYPLYASLLSDVTMLMVEQARSAMARSDLLIEEALSTAGRSDDEARALAAVLSGPLVSEANSHGETVGPDQAKQLGLPVDVRQSSDPQWQLIWALWTRYFNVGVWPIGPVAVYEGRLASQVFDPRTS